jgi:hypothetical protein
MSSKEHIQLGWIARWVLSAPLGPGPRATPHPAPHWQTPPRGWALGGLCVSCQCPSASTSLALALAPLYSPCASSATPAPAPRQLPWSVESSPLPGPGALRSGRLAALRSPIHNSAATRGLPFRSSQLALPNRGPWEQCTLSPCAESLSAKDPLAAKRSNERWRMGLFQLPRLVMEPTGAFLGLFHRICK